MKDLIVQLASRIAPSGAEQQIQEQLLAVVRDYADEVLVDTLGNAIAVKRGSGPHVSLVAHMDEIGLMVIHIEDEGFLRVVGIGRAPATAFLGQGIVFTNGLHGVVQASPKVKLAEVGYDDLFVDIGAESRDEAEDQAFIGLSGVIETPLHTVGEHRLAGRALDNRVGCAIAISAFNELAQTGRHVSIVFTAQQTVGARGAQTAAFRLQPDVAIVVDAVPAGDSPDAQRMDIKLGAGPAIKIMDGTAIVPLTIKDHLVESAKRAGVKCQFEVWPRGLSDAGSIQLSVHGIPVGGVSYPTRYAGGIVQVVDLRDVQEAVKVLVEAAVSYQ